VSKVDAGPKRVVRRVLVNAPPAEVFALVVDPHRHPALDSSGTVRDVPIMGPHHLAVGDKFTVGMRQWGVPYKITSTATEVEDGRVVEWLHPMGHRWRWDLVKTAPGTAEVTDTFDYSTHEAPALLELFGMHEQNADGITSTLERLAARFGG
jgi:uncharacterized protein YndB with AHSA1/START domain